MHLSEFIKLNFTYYLKLSSAIGEKFINPFQEISLMPEFLGIKPNAQALAYCLGFKFNARFHLLPLTYTFVYNNTSTYIIAIGIFIFLYWTIFFFFYIDRNSSDCDLIIIASVICMFIGMDHIFYINSQNNVLNANW